MKERDTVDEKRGRPGLVATRSARRPFGHQQPVNGAMRVLGAVQHHFAVSLSGQLHPATADSPAGRHRLTGPAPRPAAKCRQTPSSAVVKKPRRREGGGGGPPVSHQPRGLNGRSFAASRSPAYSRRAPRFRSAASFRSQPRVEDGRQVVGPRRGREGSDGGCGGCPLPAGGRVGPARHIQPSQGMAGGAGGVGGGGMRGGGLRPSP